ncbi:MAG: pyridoxamine 5'-phosphate oxidase [Alphaproteobacteria bacterium]|nr:pyridoxamine 5'-phosphate oxidase [Alphaproteobacteria bacterium]MCD8519715.1 pyridoxamine 5'-phosphate oxidase [Alphaproteobacteria bacterium]MCD8525718.1 pyridoxamine 5'-phosphate oxidase [Alphaproteobacteria bacterium]MCD8570706.1 pyridoxamine 5'-phosphate oxidase [Alphaproteobacteria bacterium]
MTNIIPQNPNALFEEWFREAQKSEPNDPSAMAVSLIDAEGKPSVRIVLMRKYGEKGFEFFTNYESRKGKGLEKNPYAELCFYWKSLHKQIRITGRVEKTSAAESDDYFNNRPRGSRVGAWASQQSRPMEGYEELQGRMDEFEAKFEGMEAIPRPPHWGGFRVIPERIEFWEEQPFRLHKRFVYIKQGNTWKTEWLYP